MDALQHYIQLTAILREIAQKAYDARALAKGSDKKGLATIKPYLDRDLENLVQAWPKGLKSKHLGNLGRHLHFGEKHDFDDILANDLPGVSQELAGHFSKVKPNPSAGDPKQSPANVEAKSKSTPLLYVPQTITASLRDFRKDYPDASRVCFIMMQFGTTPAHARIVKAIKDTLRSYGLAGLRADDKEYHDDLFPNIQTYLHGCSFGIAVFERIEGEQFSPNVSLEVGHMQAMGKPVCFLKDKTLKTLHADLIAKLYKSFDPQDAITTIPPVLTKWLADKNLVWEILT